jgi:hypothetical protein
VAAIVPGLLYRKTQVLKLTGRGSAESFGAFGAGANVAEVIVAVDAGGVAIGEAELNGVVAYHCGSLCARLGLEHRQRGR